MIIINQYKALDCYTHFDGTNEAVTADSLASAVSDNNTGAWSLWFRMSDVTPSGTNVLLSFGDTNANSFLLLAIATTGEIVLHHASSGFNYAYISTDASLVDNTWHHVKVEQNATAPVIKIDNTALSLDLQSGSNTGYWNNDAAGLDNFRIGCRNKNSGGNDLFFAGDIENVFISRKFHKKRNKNFRKISSYRKNRNLFC